MFSAFSSFLVVCIFLGLFWFLGVLGTQICNFLVLVEP